MNTEINIAADKATQAIVYAMRQGSMSEQAKAREINQALRYFAEAIVNARTPNAVKEQG